jgi:hypothetical protein
VNPHELPCNIPFFFGTLATSGGFVSLPWRCSIALLIKQVAGVISNRWISRDEVL